MNDDPYELALASAWFVKVVESKRDWILEEIRVVVVQLTALDVLEIRIQFGLQVREQFPFRAPFTLFDHREENHSAQRIDANEIDD